MWRKPLNQGLQHEQRTQLFFPSNTHRTHTDESQVVGVEDRFARHLIDDFLQQLPEILTRLLYSRITRIVVPPVVHDPALDVQPDALHKFEWPIRVVRLLQLVHNLVDMALAFILVMSKAGHLRLGGRSEATTAGCCPSPCLTLPVRALFSSLFFWLSLFSWLLSSLFSSLFSWFSLFSSLFSLLSLFSSLVSSLGPLFFSLFSWPSLSSSLFPSLFSVAGHSWVWLFSWLLLFAVLSVLRWLIVFSRIHQRARVRGCVFATLRSLEPGGEGQSEVEEGRSWLVFGMV